MKDLLSAGKSVVVDNTNPQPEKRKIFIDAAKSLKVPVRAIFFDLEKDKCLYNNLQREVNTHRKHHSKKVPSIALHIFFKNLQPPTTKEGFEEVITVTFDPVFVSKADEQAYKGL